MVSGCSTYFAKLLSTAGMEAHFLCKRPKSKAKAGATTTAVTCSERLYAYENQVSLNALQEIINLPSNFEVGKKTKGLKEPNAVDSPNMSK